MTEEPRDFEAFGGPGDALDETTEPSGAEDGDGSDGQVTRLLATWRAGDAGAADELLHLVYRELRGLAATYLRQERRGHTLQPTALVHEAYLRMMGPDASGPRVENRSHFFAVAARAMRRILVEHARAQKAEKRVGAHRKVSLDEGAGPEAGPALAVAEAPDLDVLAVHQALDRLEEAHPRQAKVIELRFFGGLSEGEVAEALAVSRATVAREWQVSRLLLRRQLRSDARGVAPGGA